MEYKTKETHTSRKSEKGQEYQSFFTALFLHDSIYSITVEGLRKFANLKIRRFDRSIENDNDASLKHEGRIY